MLARRPAFAPSLSLFLPFRSGGKHRPARPTATATTPPHLQVREMTEWGKEGETERSEGRKGESSSNFNSSWGKVEVACGDPRRPMTRAGRHVLLQIQHGNSRLESTRAMVGDGEDCRTQGAHDY